MTFYQELKEFFKKNDPQRLYMANKIARKFRLGTEQKVVLNRLKVIYDNGGPANIELNEYVAPPVIENVADEVIAESTEEVSQENVEIEIDIEGETQEIIIDTPGDDDKKA